MPTPQPATSRDQPAGPSGGAAAGCERVPGGRRRRRRSVRSVASVGGGGSCVGRHRVPPSRRATIARAAKLTAKVMTNSTRPVAISALTRRPVASGNCSAMFAAIVTGSSVLIRLKVMTPVAESTMATAIVSPSARPRPSIDAETMPERAKGSTAMPDHLPAGGAEGQGGLLVQLRGLQEDLAGDRGDDRQDHDRQHDAGGEDGPAGGRRRAGEERQEAEVRRRASRRAGVRCGPRKREPHRP